MHPERYRRILFKAVLFLGLLLGPTDAFALTVQEVAKDLACPCQCPLILRDCNMTCGLEWKDEVGRMIAAGKTKRQIMDYFVASYGDSARLTAMQKINGKIYQYTRGFGTKEWALLSVGLAVWAGLLFLGFYWMVKRLFFRARGPIAAPHGPEFP